MGDQRSVAVSTAIFLAGMRVSGAIYFSGRAVTFNDAVISNFLSPSDNPNGYLPAALATALAGLMLAPTEVTLCRRMGRIHRWGSILGTAFYATGLLAAILIGLPGSGSRARLFHTPRAGIYGVYQPADRHFGLCDSSCLWRENAWAYCVCRDGTGPGSNTARSQLRSGLAGKYCEWGLCGTSLWACAF